MYLKKAEYLKSIYPTKDCISAVTTTITDNGALVGTPCIVQISPFTTNLFSLFDDSLAITKNPKKKSDEKSSLTGAKELYGMTIAEANALIHRYTSKLRALFVFSTANNYNDFFTSTLQSKSIYFSGIKPIISDEGKRFDISRLSDVHNKQELGDFAEMTYNSLQDHRYINYTFTGVAKSNKKYMTEDINTIFNSLETSYPFHLSSFQSVHDGLRSLIDVVSISFYRLTDVTAIFDSKRSIGMGVDVFLTSSAHTVKNMSDAGRSITYRFLFSASGENIFTIDGEVIQRPSSAATQSIKNKIYSVMGRNVPNDEALKEKKPKRGRRKTCAE
jgi:hypothetical protein